MTQEYSYKGVMNKAYTNARQFKTNIMYRYKGRAKIVCELLNKHLGKCDSLSLLDFGSADGLTLNEINSHMKLKFAVGIDLSDELLRNLTSLPPNIQIIKGDVMDLPKYVEQKNFDIVTALCFLEHIEVPEKVIRYASSFLRPGGLFVAVWPNPIWDYIFMALAPENEKYHLSKIRKKQMFEMISKAGMQLIHHQKTQWFPLRILSRIKSIGTLPIETLLGIENIVQRLGLFNSSFVCEVIAARKTDNQE